MKTTKTYLLLAASLLLVGIAFGGDDGWLDNFEKAKTQAAKDGKAILACFTGSDWCPYCIKLEKEVLSTDDFKKWAEDKAVLMMVDFPRRKSQKADVKKQNAKLQDEYGIRGFPTVLFLSAEGEVLGKTGYTHEPPEKWVKSGDRAIDPYLEKLKAEKIDAEKKLEAEKAAAKKAEEEAMMARREKLGTQGYREWTDNQDRKVFAKFFGVAGDIVGLVDENGKKLRVKVTDLSQEDQDYIKSNKLLAARAPR